MEQEFRPDFFAPCAGEFEAALRRIKGNHRRQWVLDSLQRGDPPQSIPPGMLDHDLAADMKAFLQRRHPQFRGGEDLPDLHDDEVEVARITLVDSVHGEVVSVRARPIGTAGTVRLRVVDEYETEIRLPAADLEAPPTATELLRLLQEADPSPLVSSCELRLESFFYPDLDALADRLGVKALDECE